MDSLAMFGPTPIDTCLVAFVFAVRNFMRSDCIQIIHACQKTLSLASFKVSPSDLS
jgi:hypothetical protein